MRKKRGFTLLEILIAMSLFTVLGFGVVLLMRTGVDMWLAGTRSSVAEDLSEEGRPWLEEDLRHVLVPSQHDRIPFDPKNPDPDKEPAPKRPENRFISGYVMYQYGDQLVRCRYLSFVRDLTGLAELDIYAARAGQNAKADAYIDGKNDEAEFKAKNHLPTGGAVEVLWIWLPKSDTELGVGTVHRAYRSPIGGKDTLLDPANFATLRQLRGVIKPQAMFENVILFDMLFWTQFTTTWDWSAGEPRVTSRPTDPGQMKGGRPPCGPSRIWDSTRGILFTTNELGFRLTRGQESANRSSDDIWPRMVRIEFARAEETTYLVKGMGAGENAFTVESSAFAVGRGDLFGKLMKVGPEWLQISGRDSSETDIFNVDRHAQRGTQSTAKAEGTPVYFGRVQDFTIGIPSFRDDNN